MLVGDVLRKQYTRLDAADTLPEICRIFTERHIASAPVQKNDQFIGVVSDTDILATVEKKRLSAVWDKDKPTPGAALAAITAGSLAKKPKFTLSSTDKLSDAMPKIMRREIDLVPVVDDGTLVGIIRGTDIIGILSKEFAKKDIKDSTPGASAASEGARADTQESVDTVVDTVLSYVEAKKSVTISELAAKTSLPRNQLEKIARSLESHHLISLDFPLFGEMTLKVLYHE